MLGMRVNWVGCAGWVRRVEVRTGEEKAEVFGVCRALVVCQAKHV